jgi:hypothetical protein
MIITDNKGTIEYPITNDIRYGQEIKKEKYTLYIFKECEICQIPS